MEVEKEDEITDLKSLISYKEKKSFYFNLKLIILEMKKKNISFFII